MWLKRLYKIIYNKKNFEGQTWLCCQHPDFVVSIVTADGLAPLCAKTAAGTSVGVITDHVSMSTGKAVHD